MEFNISRLKEKDKNAINKFKKEIIKKFPEAKFILYGSKAKFKNRESSDIDILVLLKREINTKMEKEIFDIGFEIGLKYDVVFGIVVEEDAFWNSKLAKEMPFYVNIAKEGIKL